MQVRCSCGASRPRVELDLSWTKMNGNRRRALNRPHNDRSILPNQPLMKNEAGGGDHLPVADQRSVFLRSSVGAENVSRVD